MFINKSKTVKCIFCLLLFAHFCFGNKESIAKISAQQFAIDTTLCAQLVNLIDNESDHTIWIKYNTELQNLCTQKLEDATLNATQKNTYLKFKTIAHTNGGAYFVFNDDVKRGITEYRKSLQIAKQINYLYSIVLSYQNIGTAKDRIGELDSAIYYLKEAYKYAKKSTDKSITAYVLTDLGYAFNNIGDYVTAINYNIKALKLFETLKDIEGIERTCFAIGRIFDTQNDYAKACEYYKRCEKLASQLNNVGRKVFALQSIANDYLLMNKIDDALLVNNTAIKLSQQINSKNSLSLCHKLMGDIYVRKNNYVDAITNYTLSASIAKSIGSENFYEKAIFELAKIAWQKKEYIKAQNYATESYSIAKKLNYVSDIITTSELLSKIFEQENNFKKAFEYKKIAALLNDSLVNNKSKNVALKAEFKYQSQKQETEIESLNNSNKIVALESKRKSLFLYIVFGTFISVVLISYFLFRRYKDKQLTQSLQTKLTDAQLLLSAERRASESEIKAIKSQMNPHFFYNALNSIQGYIYSGDKENAAVALGLFSDLSRAVLDSSRNTEINLVDEIALLQNYLKLETMRMPKINYEIIVDKNIDVYETYLPSMLLQPLVENAINHGLANSANNSQLLIEIHIENSFLHIKIDDNGIGRKAAEELGKRMRKKSASFSTNANMSRIELLNNNRLEKIEQQIIDKIDANGTALGTTINIKIPIKNYD